MVTFVDCGEIHGKEIRRRSVIPIIVSGRVSIRRIDKVYPERGWMSRTSGYASGRPVEHLVHDLVAWEFEQPKRVFDGSSVSRESKPTPNAPTQMRENKGPDSRSNMEVPLPEQGRVGPTPSAGRRTTIRKWIDMTPGSTVREGRASHLNCWCPWMMSSDYRDVKDETNVKISCGAPSGWTSSK